MPPEFVKLALIALIGLIVASYAYFHARAYNEGLPPIFDAFFSGVGFAVLCGAYIFGGRLGIPYEMATEGRVAGLGMAIILLRWLRARLGVELARWKAHK